MKVRLKKRYKIHEGCVKKKGTELDMWLPLARKLIKKGIAEDADKPKLKFKKR